MSDQSTSAPVTTRGAAAQQPRRPPKRERLIAAALEEIHRHGYAGTTLAKIAEAADVPIGNVYYYFKTKDDLLRAVVDTHLDSVEQMLASAETHEQPKQRILAFVDGLRSSAAEIAAYGCPLGCLTQDLGRVEEFGDVLPASTFSRQLDWLERQFEQAGVAEPRTMAVHVMARTQGAATMCHSLGESAVLHSELDRLRDYIETEL